MRQVHWIRNTTLRAVVVALALVLALTSCSLGGSPEPEADAAQSSPSAQDAEVRVSFPGRDDLQAATEPVEPTEEMAEVLPAGTEVHDTVDITLVDGEFPDTGASVTFDIDEPLPEGAAPAVVHWNEETAEWEPLPSELSADGESLTAEVEHFSVYGWVDGLYNWLNEAAGNFGDAPTCPGQEPDWSDTQFFDDMNGPLLWCVGTDQNNPDILEVRVVSNRSSAMLISTGITPVWAWSDVLGDTGPETWIGTLLGGEQVNSIATSRYLIPPAGEYRFGFAKDELFEFWRTDDDDVLIQAETSGATVVGGLAYSALSDQVGDKLAAVTSMVALAECGYTIEDLADNATGAAIVGAYLSCLGGQRDNIERVIESQFETKGEDLVKRIRYAGAYYALVKGTLALGSLIGDATLPEHVRQMVFTPSTALIQERLSPSGTKTYTGEAVDASFSFEHPAGWEIQDEPGQMNGTVVVTAPGGAPVTTLTMLLVWDAVCGGPVCEPRPVHHLGDVPGRHPLSKSGDFVARSVAIDLSGDPQTRQTLGWEDNVLVATSLTDAETPVPTMMTPLMTYGLGQVETETLAANGTTSRLVLFTSYRYFPTLEEAREYAESQEHQDVLSMIASFRG